MHKRTVIGLAIAGLALTYAPAYADTPETHGLICQFASVIDPTAEEGTQSGQISGGPVLLLEQDGMTPETGTLLCRIQVNNDTHTGTGPTVSGHGTGVLVAAPATVTYLAADTDTVSLCAEFVDDSDGVTYYWDGVNGEWSTSSAVPCGLAEGGTGDPSDDRINLLPCPIFAQLPSPLAETLQETWEDCMESGPNSVITVVGTGATATVVPPPLWSCSTPTITPTGGSVSCSPPGLNSLTNCKEVLNLAVATPGGGSVTGTTTCGANSVSATAPLVSLQARVSLGTFTTMPVLCQWGFPVNPPPAVWATICGWNLPIIDDDSISLP